MVVQWTSRWALNMAIEVIQSQQRRILAQKSFPCIVGLFLGKKDLNLEAKIDPAWTHWFFIRLLQTLCLFMVQAAFLPTVFLM